MSSQNFFDIYSLSHITHGFLFYNFFHYNNFKNYEIIIYSIIMEIIWEYIENTPYIINKYRSKKKFMRYRGDSHKNIIGDIIFTIIVIYLTKYSLNVSLICVILLEIVLSEYQANFLYLSFGSLL